MLGYSTFGLSMGLLKWFPVHFVDCILLWTARTIFGDTARLGLKRPAFGPLELKSLSGKTPVLDVGTFAKIKSGDIKVCLMPPKYKACEIDCSVESIDQSLSWFSPDMFFFHHWLNCTGTTCHKTDIRKRCRIRRWSVGGVWCHCARNWLQEQRSLLAEGTLLTVLHGHFCYLLSPWSRIVFPRKSQIWPCNNGIILLLKW